MTITVKRRFVYEVEGVEYKTQGEANKAAQAARKKLMQDKLNAYLGDSVSAFLAEFDVRWRHQKPEQGIDEIEK